MGKVIGLDLGTRTLGIAISDSLGMIAYGRETHRFENGNYKEAATYAVEYAKKEDCLRLTPSYERRCGRSCAIRDAL